jgi:hypothetical protein
VSGSGRGISCSPIPRGAVAIAAGQVVEVVAEARRIVAADAGFMEQIRTEDAADVRGDER